MTANEAEGRVARIILTLVFVGLIASPVIMKRLAARREVAQAECRRQIGARPPRILLAGGLAGSGINFVHQSPTLDPKLEPIMPEVASMGAARVRSWISIATAGLIST